MENKEPGEDADVAARLQAHANYWKLNRKRRNYPQEDPIGIIEITRCLIIS